MAEKKNTTKQTKLEKEMKQLKDELKSLQENFGAVLRNMQPQQTSIDEREVEIVSLNDGVLNLSTDGHGHGLIYKFETFGETQPVPVSDAKLLIKNNNSFFKEGRCYINDEELVKKHNLTSIYKKIINKESFEGLFNEKKETFEKAFTVMPKTQQKIFANLLSEKIVKGELVDMNIVKKVEDLTGLKIVEKAEASKNIFESEKKR